MLTHTKLTIGEMAKIHRIPESTLRYYDEKGIFHPAFTDPQNQYRYYTVDQFSMLDTIKFLRHLGIPLKGIKHYLDERNPANTADLLLQQKELMEQKQKEMALMIQKMEHTLGIIRQASESAKGQVVFKDLPPKIVRSAAMVPNATDEMIEYYIQSLQSHFHLHDANVLVGTIGVTVSKEAYLSGHYGAYKSIFIQINDLSKPVEHNRVIEEGRYACMYHHGPYDQTAEAYRLLLQEIEANHYEPAGDSVEMGLIDLSITGNPEEFITEIQIPVQKRGS
ncbi:MerR family transcriptional regulator [Paenibacillus sp. GCM10027627]|uniref:MerR family transcriptional regulator n=1 Tax=unclassified Paenibacillus TaxID=185978 RepID=UPI003634E895